MTIKLIPAEDAAPDEDCEMPDYSDPGRILFRWYRDPEFSCTGWFVEVYDYDSDSCLLWLEEGLGIADQLHDCLELEQEGWYVAEGVTGSAWKDRDGEVDEEWDFGTIRYATEAEIKTEALS